MPALLKVLATSAITNGSGVPLVSGTISFVPTDAMDNPIPVGIPADGSTGARQAIPSLILRTITNGSIDGGDLYLANPAVTSPANIFYRIVITDLILGTTATYRKVQVLDAGNGTWNFATWNTGLSLASVPMTFVVGPTGAQGPSGVVSGVQVANAVTRDVSGNVFNPATVTMDAVLSTTGSIIPIVGDPRWFVSDYITVKPGGWFVCTQHMPSTVAGYPALGPCFYDITDAFISGTPGVAAGVGIPVPNNAVSIRFPSDSGNADGSGVWSCKAYLSQTLPAASPDPVLTAIALANAERTGNLFDGALTRGAYINANPADPYFASIPTGQDGRFWLTNNFPVVPGGQHVASLDMLASGYNAGIVYFDQAGHPITGAGVAAGVPFTAPSTAVSARASGFTSLDATKLVIVNGPTLPAGYLYPGLGLYTSTTLATVSKPALGKRWLHFGDSISAIYGGGWLPQVAANTGMNQVGQDAQTGRATSGIFGMFSGTGGNYNPAASSGVSNVWADGVSRWAWDSTKNLAQNLAAIAPDIITIYLGTNDLTVPPGTPGDATTAGTECGYVRAAIETLLTTLPNARILWIAPYKVSYGQTTTPPIVAAIAGTCALYGVPVLDLNATSGICALTQSFYLLLDTGDGAYVHPNGNGDAMLARRVSAFINQQF